MREDELFKSHIPLKRDGSVVGYRETPYCTLIVSGYNVTVKQGNFYGLGGDPIDPEDLPDAVWQQLANMNPVVLAELGVDLSKRVANEIEAAPKESKPLLDKGKK